MLPEILPTLLPVPSRVEDHKSVIGNTFASVSENVPKLQHHASVPVLFSLWEFKAQHPALKLSISYWENNLSPLCHRKAAAVLPFLCLWSVPLQTGISLILVHQGVLHSALYLCTPSRGLLVVLNFLYSQTAFHLSCISGKLFYWVTAWEQWSAKQLLLNHMCIKSICLKVEHHSLIAPTLMLHLVWQYERRILKQ